MKNIITLFILLCAFSTLQAQFSFKPGIRTGVNLANLSDFEATHQTKGDFYVGIYGNLRLAKRYALQPELNYSRQGAKAKTNFNPDIDLNYFSIGLTNKLYITNGFHVLISSSINLELESNTDNSDGVLLPFTIDGLDFSFAGGLGYEFPFGLVLEARYKQGLLDREFFSNSFNNFNRAIQIGIAYQFSLSKNKK